MNEQPERPVETVQEWLRYAEEDLGVAAREFEQGSTASHHLLPLPGGGREAPEGLSDRPGLDAGADTRCGRAAGVVRGV
jgi:hypothetical protein